MLDEHNACHTAAPTADTVPNSADPSNHLPPDSGYTGKYNNDTPLTLC